MSNELVRSLERALNLIESLALNHPKGATLKELSTETNLNKTTAFRLLNTFIENDYVIKDNAGIYRLTEKMLLLGKSAAFDRDLVSVARPYLNRLSNLTGEAAQLSLIQDISVVTSYSVDYGDNPIKIAPKIGTSYPLYCTSAGKAFLANMSLQKIKEYWKEIIPERFTDRTIVSEAMLLDELNHIRKKGFALEDEEHDIGIRCISALINDNEGEAVGAVSLTAPTIRLNDDKVDFLASYVISTAKKISMNL